MQSEENQPKKSEKTTSHLKPESKSEPMTQVQADSVITREDTPNLGFRLTITLVTTAILLFFVATYFGIINL